MFSWEFWQLPDDRNERRILYKATWECLVEEWGDPWLWCGVLILYIFMKSIPWVAEKADVKWMNPKRHVCWYQDYPSIEPIYLGVRGFVFENPVPRPCR